MEVLLEALAKMWKESRMIYGKKAISIRFDNDGTVEILNCAELPFKADGFNRKSGAFAWEAYVEKNGVRYCAYLTQKEFERMACEGENDEA